MFSRNLLKCIKIFLDVNGKSQKECVFLETGLDEGITVSQILTNFNFKKIISVEIDKIKIDKAKLRFKDYSKIIFVQGDSAEKIEEIYDQSINVIFLDAHGRYPGYDLTKIFPLEKELKFLIDKINEDQLVIIDDFIKIRNSHLYNDKLDWRSYFKYKDLNQLLEKKGLKSLEIFYDNGENSYLLLTNNKNFKIDIRLFLINLFFKFKSIKFYLFYYIRPLIRYLKKIIIFLTSESFFLKIKKKFKKK